MFTFNCYCGNIIQFILAINPLATQTCCNCGNIITAHQFKENNEAMGKAVTPKNYIGHYTTWCMRNSFAPLSYDVLQEIFFGCESNDDFRETLNALFEIQAEGLKLSFMDKKKQDEIEILNTRLKLRLELFKRVPSGTNMILAYNLIEELVLKVFQTGEAEMEDKSIERFDKLKNLALSTKHIPERKLAFERSLDIFKKLTKLEV